MEDQSVRSFQKVQLLSKMQEFHRLHHTPIDQTLRDLNEAFGWLPKSAYAAEAKPLAALVRAKRRGPQRLGDLILPLLLRLGVSGAELGVDGEETLESKTSEARSPA